MVFLIEEYHKALILVGTLIFHEFYNEKLIVKLNRTK